MNDLAHWLTPWRLIREQFAAGKYPHCHIRLAVPAIGNRITNPDRPTKAEWVRLCRQVCDCANDLDPREYNRADPQLYLYSGPLFGLAKSVREFERLATMAANLLPAGWKPYPALYPDSAHEPSNHFRPLHAWCEFLAVTCSTQFVFGYDAGQTWESVPRRYDPGRRYCRMSKHADPFLVSTMAIDSILGDDPKAVLARYDAAYERVAALSVGVEPPPTQQDSDPPAKSDAKHVKGKRINWHMAAMVMANPESIEWSASAWADKLGCTESTVKDTRTWKQTIMAARAIARADRLQSRRRR